MSPVTAALGSGFFTTSTIWEDLSVAPLPIPYFLKGIQRKDYSSLAGCLSVTIHIYLSKPDILVKF